MYMYIPVYNVSILKKKRKNVCLCVYVSVCVFTIRVTIRNNITNVEHDFSDDFVLLKNMFLVEQLQLQTIVFDWVLYFFFIYLFLKRRGPGGENDHPKTIKAYIV